MNGSKFEGNRVLDIGDAFTSTHAEAQKGSRGEYDTK